MKKTAPSTKSCKPITKTTSHKHLLNDSELPSDEEEELVKAARQVKKKHAISSGEAEEVVAEGGTSSDAEAKSVTGSESESEKDNPDEEVVSNELVSVTRKHTDSSTG